MTNIRLLLIGCCLFLLSACGKKTVNIVVPPEASIRMNFGVQQLQETLEKEGYRVLLSGIEDTLTEADRIIFLNQACDSTLRKEGFLITTEGNRTMVRGNDGNGVIYACRELIDHINEKKNLDFPAFCQDAPEMVLRGACIGLQKTTYLPGHGVYEYPYTPENFPWFYDKQAWIRYLDMLVENRMNSLYLWNGHPFASLVRLEEYPFALEVDEETFKKNEEIFSFLTEEADKRVFSSFKCSIIFFYPNHLPIITGLKLRIVIDRLLRLSVIIHVNRSQLLLRNIRTWVCLSVLGRLWILMKMTWNGLHKPLFPE